MENKLKSMVDFVLEEQKHFDQNRESWAIDFLPRIFRYAEFLKRPLELWMFVPCDENGNVLQEPSHYDLYLLGVAPDDSQINECGIYEEYKSRVLFEGFEVKNKNFNNASYTYVSNDNIYVFSCWREKFEVNTDFETIEDLVKYNLTLTNNALKIWE